MNVEQLLSKGAKKVIDSKRNELLLRDGDIAVVHLLADGIKASPHMGLRYMTRERVQTPSGGRHGNPAVLF